MRLLIAASILFGLGCGGTAGDNVCEAGIEIECAKRDECDTQTLQECLSELDGACDSNNGCPGGATFDRQAAEQCNDQVMAATCADIEMDTADLSACQMVCQP